MTRHKTVKLSATEPPLRYRDQIAEKDRLGVGGMGEVLSVHDRYLERSVALKRLAPDHKGESVPELQQRLREEAQIMAQLDHPGIVPVHEISFDDRGRLYFTMKLVRGTTLTDMIRAALPQPSPAVLGLGPTGRSGQERRRIRQLLLLVLPICDALAYAHDRRVVHRDLKPDNVLVGEYGEVYVMDWGIAKLDRKRSIDHLVPEVDEGAYPFIEEKGRIFGSYGYLAPEQAKSESNAIDARTDVFGVGAILYEIVAKCAPFEGKTPMDSLLRSVQGRLTEPLDRFRSVPPRLREIIATALHPNPDRRYQGVRELKQELVGFLESGWSFERRVFKRGAIVIHEGADSNQAFVVVSGCCSAYRVSEGRSVHLRDMGPGDVFGETGVFAGSRRTARVKATTDAIVAVLAREDLQRDLRDGSWVSLLVTALAQRFIEKDKRVAELERELERARAKLAKKTR